MKEALLPGDGRRRPIDPTTVPTRADLSRADIAVLQHLCTDQDVVEVGAGGSTLLLSRMAAHLTSFETDSSWFGAVRSDLERHPGRRCDVRLVFVDLRDSPPSSLPSAAVYFVDCVDPHRSAWLKAALAQRATPIVCVHDSRRSRTVKPLLRVLAQPALLPWIESVAFHYDGSNMLVVRRRDRPLEYVNWNHAEPQGRLPRLRRES